MALWDGTVKIDIEDDTEKLSLIDLEKKNKWKEKNVMKGNVKYCLQS